MKGGVQREDRWSGRRATVTGIGNTVTRGLVMHISRAGHDFVKDPANFQLFKRALHSCRPQIPKPESVQRRRSDQDGCEEADALAADGRRKNFISSAKYQNWVVETAKYYYNNGG